MEEKFVSASAMSGQFRLAVGAVAATYGYFLLFAEFAFLELAQAVVLEEGERALRVVMGALGAGGVAGSVAGWWRFKPEEWARDLARSYAACALVAAGATFAREQGTLSWVAAGVGLALGWNTVTLAAGLRVLLPAGRIGLGAGLGTGMAYAVCNVPAVFEASAATQTWLSVSFATVAAVALRAARPAWREPPEQETHVTKRAVVWPWVGAFLALVWLDSAAFYIIQQTPGLREATWAGAGRLWTNASVHLGVAVAAGWLLDRGQLRGVVGAAGLALAAGCLLLGGASVTPIAGILYVAGVSLYSTALVYFPARDGRAWVVAAVFAIAGWTGSALGIGMAQDLLK